MRLRKSVKRAMDKAKNAVLNEASKPKRKRVKKTKVEVRQPDTKWIDDLWGNQGCVFFDGYHYWLTHIAPNGQVYSTGLTPQAWEERKKNDTSRRSLEREPTTNVTGHRPKTTSPTDKKGKTTSNKVGARKSVSSRKSSNAAKGKRKSNKKPRNTIKKKDKEQ